MEEGNLLFSMYFSKSEDVVDHKYTVATIINVLASFGGLYAIIMRFFGFLAGIINQ